MVVSWRVGAACRPASVNPKHVHILKISLASTVPAITTVMRMATMMPPVCVRSYSFLSTAQRGAHRVSTLSTIFFVTYSTATGHRDRLHTCITNRPLTVIAVVIHVAGFSRHGLAFVGIQWFHGAAVFSSVNYSLWIRVACSLQAKETHKYKVREWVRQPFESGRWEQKKASGAEHVRLDCSKLVMHIMNCHTDMTQYCTLSLARLSMRWQWYKPHVPQCRPAWRGLRLPRESYGKTFRACCY